jgi:Na+-transporting methylmalonyl-CoA/oxaloacetate decarboxylase gamma subunit
MILFFGLLFLVLLLLVVAAGASISYFAVRRSMRAELNELKTALYRHIQSTSEQPAVAQPAKAAEPKPAAKEVPQPVVAKPAAPAVQPAGDEVPPEILAVIAAAVAHFCGVEARIRSARLAPTAGTSAWAQWGRASVQASHNLPAQRAHA